MKKFISTSEASGAERKEAISRVLTALTFRYIVMFIHAYLLRINIGYKFQARCSLKIFTVEVLTIASDNDNRTKSISQKETPKTNGNGKRPLRQRIESALNKQDGFNKELARYGFNSSAEVAKCPSLTQLIEKVKAKQTGEVSRENLPTFAFYRKARQREPLVQQVTRDVIVSKDPVSQGLRHVRPPA
ncbi:MULTISPECIES: hypothetical protein [unclassified Okeania]|uniref:hypothetical protein n=1 Tax=unclassified Okeania TaxID=2634635 RepID=UPI0013B5DA01|nr:MULTISPECIES: hypothetical protein [unclassified Okeania]NES79214.1 hypothetical protein [Okeania sp. SIO1H4]NET22594.1 hypothetical protein [Okeania sp. SIO1H5]NET95744.1 hypothetical protein [Okeania sp. SIO1H2]